MFTNRNFQTVAAVVIVLLVTISAMQAPRPNASTANAAWAEFHEAELALHAGEFVPVNPPATSFMGVAYLMQRTGEWNIDIPAKSFLGEAYLLHRQGEWLARDVGTSFLGRAYLLYRIDERSVDQ